MSESMIEESAARLFADQVDKALLERAERDGMPEALWRLSTESGFAAALATEEAGGIGARWEDAYPILRGLGYWQVPLPLAETMIASQLLSMAGVELPDGPIAVIEQGCDNDVRATADGGALRLHGEAQRVAWARHAGTALVSLADGRLALVDLRDAGVSLTPGADLARLPADNVRFDSVRCLALVANPLPELARPVWTMGAVARSIQIVGALEWLLEQSVQYANDRVQFGKPIGKNQALQQQLALLAGEVAASRMAAIVAARDTPSAGDRACGTTVFSAAAAKVRCGEAATRGTAIAHQVHGAIGFTYEHQLHFATRRLWAWREDFGTDAWWAQRLGEAAIAARSTGFWASLTNRRFDGGIRVA